MTVVTLHGEGRVREVADLAEPLADRRRAGYGDDAARAVRAPAGEDGDRELVGLGHQHHVVRELRHPLHDAAGRFAPVGDHQDVVAVLVGGPFEARQYAQEPVYVAVAQFVDDALPPLLEARGRGEPERQRDPAGQRHVDLRHLLARGVGRPVVEAVRREPAVDLRPQPGLGAPDGPLGGRERGALGLARPGGPLGDVLPGAARALGDLVYADQVAVEAAHPQARHRGARRRGSFERGPYGAVAGPGDAEQVGAAGPRQEGVTGVAQRVDGVLVVDGRARDDEGEVEVHGGVPLVLGQGCRSVVVRQQTKHDKTCRTAHGQPSYIARSPPAHLS